MMIGTNTQLMKLNQIITTKMCISLISLRCENFADFVLRDFGSWFFSCNHYNSKCWAILDFVFCSVLISITTVSDHMMYNSYCSNIV